MKTMNVHIKNILKVISKISLKSSPSKTIVINQKSITDDVIVVERQSIVLSRGGLSTKHFYGMSGVILYIKLLFFVTLYFKRLYIWHQTFLVKVVLLFIF